jgi:hypothetical protein
VPTFRRRGHRPSRGRDAFQRHLPFRTPPTCGYGCASVTVWQKWDGSLLTKESYPCTERPPSGGPIHGRNRFRDALTEFPGFEGLLDMNALYRKSVNKLILVDDQALSMGSANVNPRSFFFDAERRARTAATPAQGQSRAARAVDACSWRTSPPRPSNRRCTSSAEEASRSPQR